MKCIYRKVQTLRRFARLLLTAFIPENCCTTWSMHIINIGIRSSLAMKNSFSVIAFVWSAISKIILSLQIPTIFLPFHFWRNIHWYFSIEKNIYGWFLIRNIRNAPLSRWASVSISSMSPKHHLSDDRTVGLQINYSKLSENFSRKEKMPVLNSSTKAEIIFISYQ